MATIGPFIEALGETIYLFRRNLGPRSAVTGWPSVSFGAGAFDPDDFDCDDFDCWADETIYGMVRELGTGIRDTPQGRVMEQRGRLFTTTAVDVRDRINYNGDVWEIEDVQFYHLLLGDLGYYDCSIIRLEE